MKKKIVVIDDEPNILEALTFILKDVAYDVVASSNGEIISSLKSDELPDLIVLDAWLATESGVDLARLLKSGNETKKIPVIIISADANVEHDAFEAGACNFLMKPFSVGVFLDAVERALA